MSAAKASSIQGVTVMTDVNLIPCGNCGKESSQCCGKYRKESYCSVICQKARRQQHKLICFPAKKELGFGLRAGFRVNGPNSHWVATRDIKEGEQIFTDYPLMIGPGETCHIPKTHICLGCHTILMDFIAESDHRKCGDCGWPLCGLTCSGIHRHLKECKTLIRMGGKKEFNNLTAMDNGKYGGVYEQVRVLRLLALIKDDPTKWERFLDLDVPKSVQNQMTAACSEDGFERTVLSLKFACQLQKLTKETMFRLKAAEMHHCRRPYFPKKDMAVSVIYDKETQMDKGCMENCHVWPIPISKNVKVPYGIVFTAAKPIQKGQRLRMKFPQCQNWDGTKRRRERLMRQPLDGDAEFICECARCCDPTELGTNVSDVKCTKCESGHLLPLSPLDDNSKWKCNTAGCKGLFPASDVDKVVNKIQTEANALLMNAPPFSESESESLEEIRRLMNQVSKFVDKYGNILSPHHYILLNVQQRSMDEYNYMLLRLVCPKDATLSTDLSNHIDRYRTFAHTFLGIGSKLYPPLSLRLLIAHYHVGMSQFFSAQQAIRNGKVFGVVHNWLNDGISHLRSVLEFKTKTSLPLYDLGYDTLLQHLGQAHDNAFELCRMTSIPGKMVDLDQYFYTAVMTEVANEQTLTAEKN